MKKFVALSKEQTNELDSLLQIADECIGTNNSVIKGSPSKAKIVGTAIGGAAGAAIAASAGSAGVAASLIGSGVAAAGTGVATAGLVGGGATAAGFIGGGAAASGGAIAAGAVGLSLGATIAVVAVPVAIAALLVGGGVFISKKKKEKKKQALYVNEIAKKMEKILDKHRKLKEEFERTDKLKDEIIRKQQEKLAEYEAIFEALKQERAFLENNLMSAQKA